MKMKAKPNLEQSMQQEQIREAMNAHCTRRQPAWRRRMGPGDRVTPH